MPYYTFKSTIFTGLSEQVQEWFESFWKAVGDWVYDAANWVYKQVSPLLDNINENLISISKWINYNIATPLSNLAKDVSSKFTDIGNAITSVANNITTKFIEFQGLIQTNIVTPLGVIGKRVIDGFNGVATFISDNAARIGEGISQVNATITSWADGIVTGIENAVKGLIEAFAKLAVDFVDRMIKAGEEAAKNPVNALINAFSPVFGVAGALIGWTKTGFIINIMDSLTGTIDWIMKQLTWLGQMITGAIDAIITAVMPTITSIFRGFIDGITGAMSAGSPDPQIKIAVDSMVGTIWTRQVEIIKKAYKSPPTPEEITNAAMQTVAVLVGATSIPLIGAVAADLAHPLKDPGFQRTVREILWMVGVPAVTASIITLPSAVGLLIPLRYALMESLQPMQPGASDIVRFAVRETFDVERRQALLANFPGSEYVNAMAREGFNRTWAEHFWGAHWVLPPITQLNEYLYRHDEFAETWRKYIRYSDYIPESIPWLEEVIYPPWTRVDIRRMWEMGVITEDLMTQQYRWGGYDQAHAELLTLWTKIYVAAPDLKARYKNGWITENDVKNELIRLGMPVERVNEFMQTWVLANKPDRTKAEKDLTKTDILKLYRIKQLDINAAKSFLMAIGYDEAEAGYLIAIEADKMDVELKDLTTSQLLKAYRFEVLTRQETKDKLIGAGWTEAAAETMLKLEDVNLADSKVEKMRERDLSLAQVIQAMGRGIITADIGVEYLRYLGYSDWEIDVILKLEGLITVGA